MPRILYRGPRVIIFIGSQGREVVHLRTARKRILCEECHRPIEAGEWYFADHITYIKRRKSGSGYRYHHIHRVCPRCWKGPKPLDYYPKFLK
jgi:hypothetical protein